MRIGFDARFYGPQVKGLGIYTQYLLKALSELNEDFEMTVFLTKNGYEDFFLDDKRFIPVELDINWYGFREQIIMPGILNNHQIDFMHFPHFNVPYLYRKPYIVTIHDLILLDYHSRRASKLSYLSYYAKYLAFRLNLRHTVNQARAILTVSEYAKSRITHYFPGIQDKITVTHIAPVSLSTPDQTYNSKDFGLNQPYILYVGNAYPHKNLEFLIQSFHSYSLAYPHAPLDLVLVGKMDYFYWRLKEYVSEFTWNQAHRVHFFGYATKYQLAALYRGAKAYVFPSLEEGFGIPPLEAMRYNIPVLSGNKASMPEILGEAASYFDPHDTNVFIKLLYAIIHDMSHREALIQKGQKQILRYSWQACAQKTFNIYKKSI